MKCQMSYGCKCKAKIRIVAEKDYKLLEFYGTHDENSHATDHSKNLKYNQIETTYDSVCHTTSPQFVASQWQSGLRSNVSTWILRSCASFSAVSRQLSCS
jgi:hypothetical protein